MTYKTLTFCAVAAVLIGCTTSEETPRPDGLTPVDLIKVQAEQTALYPQASAFAALASSGEGVIFAVDGTATYLNPTFGTRIESTISGFSDNTMCVAAAGNWSGICISLFQTQTGGYFCEGTFGDGGALNYPCTLQPVLRPI